MRAAHHRRVARLGVLLLLLAGCDASGEGDAGDDAGGPGGTDAPETCPEVPSEDGAACRITLPDGCCADGLRCVVEDDLGNGTCRRTCDAHAVPTGCGDDVCLPDDPSVQRPLPSPGFCVAGAACSTDDPTTACGADATCSRFRAEAFTRCVPAGDVRLDGVCDDELGPFCAAGSSCVLGRCVAPCDADGNCAAGSCVDWSDRLDGGRFAFCHRGCDPFGASGCPADEVCVVADSDQAGRAVAICVPGDAGDGAQGDDCAGSALPHGDCATGHLCQSLAAGAPASCVGLCDDTDQSLCVAPSVCLPGLLEVEGLGVCLGECAPLGENTCGAGRMCTFGRLGLRGGEQQPAGFCISTNNESGTGAACTVSEDGTETTCQHGDICIPTNAGSQCFSACDNQASEESVGACPRGQMCRTFTDLGLSVESDRFGLCFAPAGLGG